LKMLTSGVLESSRAPLVFYFLFRVRVLKLESQEELFDGRTELNPRIIAAVIW
jgi:hypothetical protein